MCRLVAFALAVAGLCAGSAARADEAEDRAVAFVEKLGGKVTRTGKAPGKPVVGVSFGGFGKAKAQVTDAGVKELAPLTNLTTLDLSSTQVTDAGVKELAPLTNLTTLYLSDTRVTDAGLKELAPLKNLTKLDLGGCRQVTDAGVKELAPLTTLTSLNLSNTKVTDAGVKELQKALPKCRIRK